MNFDQMHKVMHQVFRECDALRAEGHAEYAGEGSDAFANFHRLAESLKLDRKQILLVYAQKHWDGIASFVAGHQSQRESVKGRINDMIVYLCLLRGMVEEEPSKTPQADFVSGMPSLEAISASTDLFNRCSLPTAPNRIGNERHLAKNEIMDNGDFRYTCSCKATWIVSADKPLEEHHRLLEAHYNYNKPPTTVL